MKSKLVKCLLTLLSTPLSWASEEVTLDQLHREQKTISVFDMSEGKVVSPLPHFSEEDQSFLSHIAKDMKQNSSKKISPTLKNKIDETLKKYGLEIGQDEKALVELMMRMR